MARTDHCLHVLNAQLPPARVCCFCGLRQAQQWRKAPGHGPHAPHDYVWAPSSTDPCPALVKAEEKAHA